MSALHAKNQTSELAQAVSDVFADKTIALVGLMGVGKSTIGRQLAPILGRKFVDSDDEIELAARLSISDIFENLGEQEFRRGERAVIKRIIEGPPIVLATGGGAYLAQETRNLLREKAITVWLDADLDTLWERVSRRDTRPLLKQENPKGVLANLKAARHDTYAEADVVVTSKNVSLDETVSYILKELARFGGKTR